MKIAKQRYQTHRSNSKTVRKIDFELTFEEWYNWWLLNGVDKDKETRPNLCMCRYNDVGPYSLDNIYLGTRSSNTKDSHLNNRHIKKRVDYSGNYKKVKTPFGIFESRKQAAEILGVKPGRILYRIQTNPSEYAYIK